MEKNIFNLMESDYQTHKRAYEIAERKFQALEKRRSYFWQIVGDPPILKPFVRVLRWEWFPDLFVCLGVVGFLFLVSSMIHTIVVTATFLAIIAAMLLVMRKTDARNRIERDAVRRWKSKYFGLKQRT